MRYDARSESGRIASLDGARGLAILIVLIHNASFIQAESNAWILKLVGSATAAGWTGVQLFFVLSGLLITGILLEAVGSRDYFRRFYVRRTLRIFPLYYAVLAGAFLVIPLLFGPSRWSEAARQNQGWFWTYTANWGDPLGHGVKGLSHFWSLAVEEQFYLIWPLLVVALPPKRLLYVCAGVLVLSPFIRLLLYVGGLPSLAISEFTICRLDALAAGAMLAILLRESTGPRWLAHWHRRIGWASAIAIVCLVAFRRSFHEGDIWIQVLGQTPVIALSGWLLVGSVTGSSRTAHRIGAVLSTRWLRFLGKYSYAIYVFHWPIHVMLSPRVGDLVNTGGPGQRLVRLGLYVAGIAVLSVVAALLSWRVLEAPLLRLKDRIAPRPVVGARVAVV
jgi:peptidoglycan/LPS O-acetylase OafA/YrhL